MNLILITKTAKVAYILVLIYQPFSVGVEPRTNLRACQREAVQRIGEKLPPDHYNVTPPHVAAAFCTQGKVEKAK